jgi:hypothetical protein
MRIQAKEIIRTGVGVTDFLDLARKGAMLLLSDADGQSQSTAKAHAREREVDPSITAAAGGSGVASMIRPLRVMYMLRNTQDKELSHHRRRRLTVFTVLVCLFINNKHRSMTIRTHCFGFFINVIFFRQKIL